MLQQERLVELDGVIWRDVEEYAWGIGHSTPFIRRHRYHQGYVFKLAIWVLDELTLQQKHQHVDIYSDPIDL